MREVPLYAGTCAGVGWKRSAAPITFFFFFFTLVTGPTRPLSLKLSDTRVF